MNTNELAVKALFGITLLLPFALLVLRGVAIYIWSILRMLSISFIETSRTYRYLASAALIFMLNCYGAALFNVVIW